MTSRGQCPRGGGVLVNVFTPPPPPSGNPVSARLTCVPPIQVQTPPHLAGWLYGPGLVVLTAGKGLKWKRFLIMQKIYPPPLPHGDFNLKFHEVQYSLPA